MQLKHAQAQDLGSMIYCLTTTKQSKHDDHFGQQLLFAGTQVL